MYHQCTNNSTVFSSLVLRVCQQENVSGNYIWAQMHNDSQVCDAFISGPC